MNDGRSFLTCVVLETLGFIPILPLVILVIN